MPPTTSTSGIRYGGLNGCPTTVRSGWAQLICISLIPNPDVEDEITTWGAAAASMSASSWRFSSRTSGALSWTKSVSSTALLRSGSYLSRSRSAPSVRPIAVSAGQAASTRWRSLSSASGAGSQATTS